MKKSQEILRNSLEQANAEKAAKQVLSKELSEATAARDQLINELNKIKKVWYQMQAHQCHKLVSGG